MTFQINPGRQTHKSLLAICRALLVRLKVRRFFFGYSAELHGSGAQSINIEIHDVPLGTFVIEFRRAQCTQNVSIPELPCNSGQFRAHGRQQQD